MFHDVYGLSCVENQVLAFCRELGDDLLSLYAGSGLPLAELYENLVERGETAVGFTGLPRIQDRLKEAGCLRLRLSVCSPESLPDRTAAFGPRQALLAETAPAFTKSRLCARGWREDHFVRLYPRGAGEVELLNDIPEMRLSVSSGELGEAFTGRIFEMERLNRVLPPPIRSGFPAPWEPPDAGPRDCADAGEWAARISQLLTVYRTTRLRLRAACPGASPEAGDVLAALDRERTALEYSRLRRSCDSASLAELLSKLSALDGRLLSALQPAGNSRLI